MIPIFEQGSGRGIGHSLKSFQKRFDEIYLEHLKDKRAKSFAFLFYDFGDYDLRRILKDQGVFAKLDRLAGRELSLFYLHTGSREAIEVFNAHFLSALGVQDQAVPPCVVFFRLEQGNIADIEIAQLESADLIHGFHELYAAIETYISQQPAISPSGSNAIKWLKGGVQFVSVEAFRALLKKGLEFLF